MTTLCPHCKNEFEPESSNGDIAVCPFCKSGISLSRENPDLTENVALENQDTLPNESEASATPCFSLAHGLLGAMGSALIGAVILGIVGSFGVISWIACIAVSFIVMFGCGMGGEFPGKWKNIIPLCALLLAVVLGEWGSTEWKMWKQFKSLRENGPTMVIQKMTEENPDFAKMEPEMREFFFNYAKMEMEKMGYRDFRAGALDNIENRKTFGSNLMKCLGISFLCYFFVKFKTI